MVGMKQASSWLAACLFAFSSILASVDGSLAQRQKPDTDFRFDNTSPAFKASSGPTVVISTTNSRYVANGSLDPFAQLAQSDGFQVTRQTDGLVRTLATQPDLVVIANPYAENFRDFPAMTPPSAFSKEEIQALKAFVSEGGSLLILADHAPFGGGSSELAAAFGFDFLNGHAAETRAADAGVVRVSLDFRPGAGLNTEHPITNGATGREAITRFYAFGGQAFIPSAEATQLLTVPQGWSAIFTYRLRAELTTAMRIDASGLAQGAAMTRGEGRLAVFGEAGGFTAQVVDGTRRFGFNTPEGDGNPEFVLATLRWLVGYEAGGQ